MEVNKNQIKGMFNHNLICENLTDNSQELESGFKITKEERFKKLKVINSNEDDVTTGDIAVVRITAGEPLELFNKEYTVINRGEIIFIV